MRRTAQRSRIPDLQLQSFCLHLLRLRGLRGPVSLSLDTAVIKRGTVTRFPFHILHTRDIKTSTDSLFVVHLHSTYNGKRGHQIWWSLLIHIHCSMVTDRLVQTSSVTLCFSISLSLSHTHTHLGYLIHTFTGMDRYCTFPFCVLLPDIWTLVKKRSRKIKEMDQHPLQTIIRLLIISSTWLSGLLKGNPLNPESQNRQ